MRAAINFLAFILVVGICFIGATAPVQAQGIRYEVSESVTNNRIVGWERGLTARDPNLSKWHWEPINTFNHNLNVRKIVDPAAANANVPTATYQPSHYMKPIHVAMPVVSHGVNGSNQAAVDLSGRLMRQNRETPLTAQARPTATYADYAKRDGVGYGASSSAKTNVAGNIIHKSGRRSACNETPKYF